MLVFAAVAGAEPQKNETAIIEEEILKRIAEGEKNAFCELYEKTGNIIFSYALSLLRNREDAEDVMQETYLKIRSAAHLYHPMGKPMAWIFTIARNVCLMKLRQRNHYSDVAYEELREEMDCSQIKDREDRIVLETAFQILSKEECQVIVLYAVSGMKHREIGEILELPVSTVLSRYSRGIKKLRKELEGKL